MVLSSAPKHRRQAFLMAIAWGREKNVSFRVNTLILYLSFPVCQQCCPQGARSLRLFLIGETGTIFTLQNGREAQRKNTHQACTEPSKSRVPQISYHCLESCCHSSPRNAFFRLSPFPRIFIGSLLPMGLHLIPSSPFQSSILLFFK